MATAILATACRTMHNPVLADSELRNTVFDIIPREVLTQALVNVNALVRPPDDVYFRVLNAHYPSVRIFMPTLLQLNYSEGRHSLARNVFHGKRGELRQRYREGQEDQLSALGLVINIIVLWNTIYISS